jgi:excinuclease UvrABC nuclease subunit
VERIKSLSPADISKVPGISLALAERITSALNNTPCNSTST